MKFTLNKNNLDGLVSKLKELDQNVLWAVTVKPYKSTRTLDQNDYYWSRTCRLLGVKI